MALAINIDKEVSIITSVKNILKACKFLKVNYVEHKQFGIGELIKNKREVDSEIDKLINIIKEDELHFSHTQFAVFCFYLVKKINDNNMKTVFHNFEFVYSKPNFKACYNRNYLFTKAKQILISHLYNIPIEVRMSTENSYMLSFNLDYINKYCYNVIDDKDLYYDITLRMFKDFKFEYPEIDNLFIAQTFTNESFFRKDKINLMLPMLNRKSISIKNHPKLGPVKGLENCDILPDFLPVELFFKKVKGSVISFHSASLITASKFDNVKAISLLEIVKTDDSFIEKVRRNMIVESEEKIVFVANIKDLEDLLDA